jgi:integrase
MTPITEYLTIGTDERWLVRFTYDEFGQHRDRRFKLGLAHTGRGRPRAGAISETAAREEMARRRAEIEAEIGYTPAEREARHATTFGDLALAWLDDGGRSTGSPWTPATRRDYTSALGQTRTGGDGHILPVLGDRTLDAMSAEIMRAWWRGLDGVGTRTANKALTIVRRIIAWANERGDWGRVEDPTYGIRKRREPDRTSEAPPFFEPEELDAILVAAASHAEEERHAENRRGHGEPLSAADADAFALIAGTGLRRGEVLALRVGDVDLGAEPVIVIRQAVSAGETSTTKSKRSRRIPITAEAFEILERRCAGRKAGELVFPGRGGEPMDADALSRRFLRARDAAGLKGTGLTLHDVRHTFGSLLARAGYSAPEIKALLGHAKLETTGRYLHHRPRHGDAERLTRALGGHPTSTRLRAVA